MTDANTICHDVDLLGDWLDAKGYTEEAGLCLRVLGLIHEQAEENAKLREALKDCESEMRSIVSYIRCEGKWAHDSGILLNMLRKADAAAKALKETGDD